MITDHAPVFITKMTPYRQGFMYTLVMMSQHGINHIGSTFRLYDCQQRMQCPVSVPQGENRVIDKSFRLVYLVVDSPVQAIYIHVFNRIDKRVVQ
ncbi:hypothetical protein SDC9_147761 [bioreactor metagenome]|uniref:Uncharacterized protein n=1 Tax=bioreactor metagenome TaxID=1076179 RepID=A0A645EEU3_9ZZZZ